jgi:hypothetical protein
MADVDCYAEGRLSLRVMVCGVFLIKFPQHQNDIKQHLTELLKTTQDGTFAGLVADDLASFHDPSVMPDIHRAFEYWFLIQEVVTVSSNSGVSR